jgi:hypothetical protein
VDLQEFCCRLKPARDEKIKGFYGVAKARPFKILPSEFPQKTVEVVPRIESFTPTTAN